jgi:hypothetical protein
MIRQVAILTIAVMLNALSLVAEDIESVRSDLVTPSATDHAPAPGKRVRQINKNYAGTEVYHLLYLPTDWVKGKKYPVIVEYAGNRWRTSPGTVEGSNLGYGISGGKGVIWICMPFVDKKNQMNAATWWGDVDATVEYCKKTVNRICTEYGGDSSNVFIAGVPGMAHNLRSESLRARYKRSRREAKGQLRCREAGWEGSPTRKYGAMNKNRILGVVHSGPVGT